MKCSKMLIGIGNMMVELCSAEMLLSVWRYLSWKIFVNQTPPQDTTRRVILTCRADGLSDITSAASLRALLAFCSPSAAIT